MRLLFPLLATLALSACSSEVETEGEISPTLVLDYEGEYRIKGGTPRFMVCSTHKSYQLIGDKKLVDDINISYNNYITLPEDPVKMWMRATPASKDIHGTGLLDSVLIVKELLHMTPEQFCPNEISKEASGRYETRISDGSNAQRHLSLALFEDGMAIMFTRLNNSKHVIEEEGKWGFNSSGDLVLELPRREKEMKFAMSGQTLTSLMYHPDDVTLILQRTGEVKHPMGKMTEVISMLKTVAAPYQDTSNLSIEFNTKIADLIPDSVRLAPVYDALSNQYKVDRKKFTERSMYFETAKDVLNFVRYSTPKQ